MQYEKLITKKTTRSVSIAGSKVASVRINNSLTTVARAFEYDKIGVFAANGVCDEVSLLDQAQCNLKQGIPYPCRLAADLHRSEDYSAPVITDDELVERCKALVSRLNQAYPEYIFSNKINTEHLDVSYSNSSNTSYGYKGSNLLISLCIKSKDSANIMDLSYGDYCLGYNEDIVVSDIGKLLAVYKNKLEISEDLPVLIPASELEIALGDVVAEKYMSGAGLFAGKLGQKIFDSKLNVEVNRRPGNKRNLPFFDAEGTVLSGDSFPVVQEGVLCGLLTNRRSAVKYGLPLSGNANAEFDAVPSPGIGGIRVVPGSRALKDAVGGKAIYVAVTSGGDMTPSGDISLPVMLAYLYEDGKLIGTLPQFTITGNIFDVLGGNFICAAENDVFEGVDETLIASKFTINK